MEMSLKPLSRFRGPPLLSLARAVPICECMWNLWRSFVSRWTTVRAQPLPREVEAPTVPQRRHSDRARLFRTDASLSTDAGAPPATAGLPRTVSIPLWTVGPRRSPERERRANPGAVQVGMSVENLPAQDVVAGHQARRHQGREEAWRVAVDAVSPAVSPPWPRRSDAKLNLNAQES